MIARLLLTTLALGAALPALAQYPVGAQVPGPLPTSRFNSAGDPADRLAGYLRTLAANPRDVAALTGAGRAALEVGDANAAIGFYARADAISPKDGAIKAGLATGLLRMGKAKDALRLFDDATDDGIPVVDIAADRGLAWDLRGEPRKAQRDYQLALRSRNNAETIRRYALSLGISGDQAGALQQLAPLLYRNDPAAQRDRAFILAMTGDVAGTETIAATVMPGPQGQAMRPFFARLAKLSAEQKARAVHFGEMPSDGTRYSPVEIASASGPAPVYRPERAAASSALPGPALVNGKPTAAWLNRRSRLLKRYSPKAAADALAAEQSDGPPPATKPAPRRVASSTGARTVSDADDLPDVLALNLSKPSAPATRKSTRAAVADMDDAVAEPSAADTAKEKAARRKADAAAKAKAAAAAKAKADAAEKKKKDAAEARAAKANPERIWVQVAGGANKGALPKAWDAAKAKSPELRGKTPQTTKVRATNRLLVGPFETQDEAQALVNKIPGAFIVTTEKGEKVEKLTTK